MTDAVVRHARLPLSRDDRLRALSLLSATEVERHRRAPSDGFLLGRLLLRELVAELTGVAPAAVVISAVCPDCGEEHGQPVSPGLHLSISHAGDLVVVAADTAPIGVDAEPADADVPAAFARDAAGWTRIEAVLKASGRGLRVDPGDVVFDGDTASVRGVRGTRGARGTRGTSALDGVDYVVRMLDLEPGFTIAVAREVPSPAATRRATRRAASR